MNLFLLLVRTSVLCSAILIAGVQTSRAQGSISSREIRELRETMEKQSKQIEILSEQVARLNTMLSAKAEAPIAAPAPVATPATVAPSAPAAAEFSSETAKAEAPEGKRHVVVKGETLTSIAKHYNLPLPELQKANKGIDERKLQIGQTLIIPTPATAETPAEKKENP